MRRRVAAKRQGHAQVEEKYRNHFREHLDAEGKPVNVQRPFEVNHRPIPFRTGSRGSKSTWSGCWCALLASVSSTLI